MDVSNIDFSGVILETTRAGIAAACAWEAFNVRERPEDLVIYVCLETYYRHCREWQHAMFLTGYDPKGCQS